MLQISYKLFSEWNSRQIQYCHWKSNEHLRPGLDGDTDLDVLLSPKDEAKAIAILKDLCFLYCKSQYGSRYPGVSDWLGFDRQSGKLIHVHLHLAIITGHRGMKEYNLPWSETALETRVKDDNSEVFIMEPNLELVTLYSRIALKANSRKVMKAKKGEFRLSEDVQRELNYLKKRFDVKEVNKIIEQYFKKYSLDIAAIVEREVLSSEDYLKLINMIEEEMLPNCRYSRFIKFVLKRYYAWMLPLRIKLKKHINFINRKTPYNGMTIAFIGQDGAGKSTVTSDVVKWLSWKLDVHKYYLGSGDHFQPWEKSLQLKLQNNNSLISRIIRSLLPLRINIKLSKSVYNKVIKAQRYAKKGGIAIFDRYPQTMIEGINDGPKIRIKFIKKTSNPLLRSVVNHFANVEEKYLKLSVKQSPDVVIKLMLPPEESIRRKPNESIEDVRRKHEIIKSLDFRNSDVLYVDATEVYDSEVLKIKQYLWNCIVSRQV